MEELIKLVEEWSKNKDLDKADPTKQALKFFEEAGEVASGLARNDMSAIEDGIGDTIVTLIILSQQLGLTLEQCLQTAYDEIKGRTGKMVNGVFVKSDDLKTKIGSEIIITKDSYEGKEGKVINSFNDEYHVIYEGNKVLVLYENEFKIKK